MLIVEISRKNGKLPMNREFLAPEFFSKKQSESGLEAKSRSRKRSNSKVIMDLLPPNGEPTQIEKKILTQKLSRLTMPTAGEAAEVLGDAGDSRSRRRGVKPPRRGRSEPGAATGSGGGVVNWRWRMGIEWRRST
jgi:hypothetical protein